MTTNMTETIKHHPSDGLLMAFSAGTLPEAFSLMVAAHVSLCDTCRAQVLAYDTLGGALMSDTVAMKNDALAATFAAIDAAHGEPERPVERNTGVLPRPVQDYVGGDLDAIRWRPVGMGVRQALLPTSRSASARLLYIPAGGAVPDHGHKGTELTMVLKGAFSDEIDRFARGDVETADEHIEHTPVADISEDCICLAVTDAPLKFNGLIPRLLQPFLRI